MPVNANCPGGTGSITITGSGGTPFGPNPNYYFNLNPGGNITDNPAVYNGLVPANYQVIVQDYNH